MVFFAFSIANITVITKEGKPTSCNVYRVGFLIFPLKGFQSVFDPAEHPLFPVLFGFAFRFPRARRNGFFRFQLPADQFSGGMCPELFKSQSAHELLVCGGSFGTRAADKGDKPAYKGAYLVFESDYIQQMQETPRRPGREAGKLQFSYFYHGLKPGNGGH